MTRVAVICPGRGTYNRKELGSLTSAERADPGGSRADLVRRADGWREHVGRPTVTELDGADRFGSSHLAGENAAALIYTASAADALHLAPDVEVVAVCGNSMGWYSALHVAGVFGFEDGLRLADTMGGFQAEEGVIGGQVILPVVDDQWRRDPVLEAAVAGTVAQVKKDGHPAFQSIRLGGYEVLAGDADAVRLLLNALPKAVVGEREYPFQLLGHSAFHTGLMAKTSARAVEELADLPWRTPRVSLVDGRGHVFRPLTTRPSDLLAYTLGHQVTDTYDFTRSVRVVLREFAPDILVLLGPGDTLGGAIGQIIVEEGWNGVRSKDDFVARQRSESPLLCAMARPEQRSLVAVG
ncbi:MAG: acyl carrier protein [Planctomycetes bacterium]|nr:acyl carrier protein [Planctomycetota bacterium]